MPCDSTTDLQRCLDRLRQGDERAREELLARSAERLRRLARKMLGDYPRLRRWEQSDDILQNAGLRLYRTLTELTPENVESFCRLASLSIRRELIDLARHYYGPEGVGAHHASHAPEGPGPEPQEHSSGDPSRLAAWTEFHLQIDALPDEEREVFDLLWYQGLTQVEAAQLLGVSERTIKRRWQSGRIRLHSALQGELPG